VSNYEVREMYKMAKSFYILQKELREKEKMREKEVLISNSSGVINVSKTIHILSIGVDGNIFNKCLF
jgi:hypothetical protein